MDTGLKGLILKKGIVPCISNVQNDHAPSTPKQVYKTKWKVGKIWINLADHYQNKCTRQNDNGLEYGQYI